MKLLQSRDDNFDVCRSFLIISMVFTHVFEMFYLPDYNRHLTYYVTIGFIFLSGFTIGALYTERFRINPKKNLGKLFGRGFKLVVIFIICNLIILCIDPVRFKPLFQLGMLGIIMSVFLGTNQSIFGFDLLIPLAFTSFFSGLLLNNLNNRQILFFLFLSLLLLWVSESLSVSNYYGVKFVITGIIGCCLGNLSGNLDWDKTMKAFSRRVLVIIFGILIILYYTIIFYLEKGIDSFRLYYHLIPTVMILFFVYMLSYDFQLSKKLVIKIPNQTLSKNMLFAYLFHIFVINVLFLFIRKDSLAFFQTSLLAFLVLFFTTTICCFVDLLNSKSVVSKKIYSSVFKL